MNDSFEQLKNELATVRMTDGERARIGHFLRVAVTTPTSHAVSTRTWVLRHAFATGSLAVLLMVGGVAVSASSAHPEDALYGFRTQVNDRIEEALARDDDAWFDVQVRQMERQLNDEVFVSDEFEADEQERLDEQNGDEELLNDARDQSDEMDDGEDKEDAQSLWRGDEEDDRTADADLEEARRIERDLGDEEEAAGEASISL